MGTWQVNVDLPDVRREGNISALTTLAPVQDTVRLRRRLRLVANWPGIGRPLLELSFIHYARWTVFDRLPAPDGSGRAWKLNWPYLLFQTNYDGEEDAYLNGFIDALPWRLTKLFGTCFGFRERVLDAPGAGAKPFPAAAFRRFVDDTRLRVLDFKPRNDYSVGDIRQALAIARVEKRARRLSGLALDRVQREVQLLATEPPAPAVGFRDGVSGPLLRRIRRAGDVTALTFGLPLEDRTLKALERLFAPDRTPLTELPAAHFARLSLLGRGTVDLGQPYPDELPTPYLLLSCDYFGSLDEFVADLTATAANCTAADALFGLCPRYPSSGNPRALTDWLQRHRMRPNYSVAGYEPQRLDDIDRLIRARESIGAQVRGTLR